MHQTDTQYSTSRTLKYLLAAFFTILAIKLFLAFTLDLYSDEIFYWQASTYPALAYSDLPFMAALLTGIGNALFGNSAIAIRSLFLLLGSAIPLLVYWIAQPLQPRRQALQAAALSLCLPLCGFLGLLAVPDVPLLFFGLIFIGSFERATRQNDTRFWIAAGIVAALGISTHYRFALYLLAAFIYLLAFPAMHRHWKSLGLWCAAALLLIGLYPALSFNLSNDLSGIDYHLLDRHPWEFQTEGLLHILKQAVLVTPLLYTALLFTLFRLYKAARAGDTSRGLFALFAMTNLGVYMLLAPWTDSTRTSIHWPLSGYLPLLVFLPETLQKLGQWCTRQFNARAAKRLLVLTIAMGFSGSLIALLGLGTQAFHKQLSPIVGEGVLSNKMAGWRDFTQHFAALIEHEVIPADAVIVTDNYYTGAQIELALPDTLPVFNIDQDKSIRDGRAVQYELWGRSESTLSSMAPLNGVFITEDSTLTVPDKIAVVRRACTHFTELHFLSQLSLLNDEKRFSFYRGAANSSASAVSCPLPSLGWVDLPQEGAEISEELLVSGWVVNEGEGVAKLEIVINGDKFAVTDYGIARPDVVQTMNVETDPNTPNLGFELRLALDNLPRGKMMFHVQVTGRSGEVQTFGAREIILR